MTFDSLVRRCRLLTTAILPLCASTASAQDAGDSRIGPLLEGAVQRARADIARSIDIWENHSTWADPWVVESQRYRVRATRSHAETRNIAEGLDTMWDHFVQTLGVEPAVDDKLGIDVVPDLATYNQIGNNMNNNLAATHSSIYGAFLAADDPARPVTALQIDNGTYLRMQITHGAVHQFLDRAFTATAPTWVTEGLASYFSAFWDYGWALSEFERIRDAGQLVPLERLVSDGIGAYTQSHPRFMQLAMLFYYLLNFREDTRTVRDENGEVVAAPFRDYLIAMLRGEDFSSLPIHETLRDLEQLQKDFEGFEFPR